MQPEPPPLLKQPQFLKLWAGQTISVFGDQVTVLALPLAAVLTLDASAFQMGVLTAVAWLPHLLLSLHAGVLLDSRGGRATDDDLGRPRPRRRAVDGAARVRASTR